MKSSNFLTADSVEYSGNEQTGEKERAKNLSDVFQGRLLISTASKLSIVGYIFTAFLTLFGKVNTYIISQIILTFDWLSPMIYQRIDA